VRQSGQDAGPVSRIRVTPAGSAVIHVPQHFIRVQNNLMAALALDVGHESDAATVPFLGRIV
jgi:hypothetical protein